jgi:hypothetical protein
MAMKTIRLVTTITCDEARADEIAEQIREEIGGSVQDAFDSKRDFEYVGTEIEDAPVIAIVMEGGFIQGVFSVQGDDADVFVIDYDVDDEEDDVAQIPQSGGETAEARFHRTTTEAISPEIAAFLLEKINEENSETVNV